MWTAAILAGGQARRLGGIDKGSLSLGPDTILERQLAVLRGLTPHIMMIVAREVPSRSPGLAPEVRVVSDRIPGTGALGGLYTALSEAPSEQVLVLAGDMPFLTAPFIGWLAELGSSTEVDVVVPNDAHGRHPLCASYRRTVAPRLKTRIEAGRLRVMDALDDCTVRDIGADELIPYDPDGRLLLNVNTPEDYARALRR